MRNVHSHPLCGNVCEAFPWERLAINTVLSGSRKRLEPE